VGTFLTAQSPNASDSIRPSRTSSVLPAGKGALYCAEFRDTKLLGEIRVERDLRTPGIDGKGNFLATVYAHIDQRKRIGFYELNTRARPGAF